MNFNPNSLRFKISVLALLILAAILVIYSALLFFSFRYLLYQELDNGLRTKAQKINNAIVSYLNVLGDDSESFAFSVQRVVSQTGDHPHKNKIEKLEQLWLGQSQPLGLGLDTVLFLDARGMPLAHSGRFGSDNVLVSQRDIQSALRGHTIFTNLQRGKEHLRAILMPATYSGRLSKKQSVILVVTSRERMIRSLRERLIFKTVSVLVILCLAALLSEMFAKRVLKPVRVITRAAKNIDYKDMSVRIHAKHIDLEMQDLVDSLNEMMDRLEKSFKYIAEFSSHVSHELKTPLAILRGETELALRSKCSPAEYHRTLVSNLDEIKRMTRIIDDLLLLTKLDYQPDVFKFEEFDLTDFFLEIGDSTRILADPKKIGIQIDVPEKPVHLRGDKVHLRRLFFNLINNAIKYTPIEGSVGLRVREDAGQAMVSVTDTGIGIPENDRPYIFDKFFRSESTVPEGASGNGLGLSIAQSIARIHEGDIQVQSTLGKGSTFTVRLPLAEPLLKTR